MTSLHLKTKPFDMRRFIFAAQGMFPFLTPSKNDFEVLKSGCWKRAKEKDILDVKIPIFFYV